MDATVLVMAKSPRPGHVKTRLCPPCTPVEAAAIAEAALAMTLQTVARMPVRERVVVLDGPVGSWLPPSFAVWPQSAGGLGDRLASAFARADGPTLLVGMDTPQLAATELVGALAALGSPSVDAVLGLALDGGWWGLGMAVPDPGAFDGVPMSSERTGAAQLARLRALGHRTGLLTEHTDVDRFADARAVAAAIPGSRFADAVAAVTRRAVARLAR